jgi:hypothetical protein
MVTTSSVANSRQIFSARSIKKFGSWRKSSALIKYTHRSGVAKEPKFRPQNTKGAEKLCGAKKIWGRNFGRFLAWFCTKTIIFLAENYKDNFPLICSYFSTILHCESWQKSKILVHFMSGRQRPNFLRFCRKVLPGVGNTAFVFNQDSTSLLCTKYCQEFF